MAGERGAEDKAVKLSTNKKEANLLILVYRDLRKGIRMYGKKLNIKNTNPNQTLSSFNGFLYMYAPHLSQYHSRLYSH